MKTFLAEVHETLVPSRTSRHGPLPPLLVAMTVVTGLVDAFSYLVLGHVFVANMTGNVVFLGFAVAGASGFSITASLVALATFWCGSVLGGRIGSQFSQHRGRHLAVAAVVQSMFLAIAVVLAAVSDRPPQPSLRYALIVVLSLATGIQNATVRKLAVPDLTTTVLTLTVTGLGADSALGGGNASKSGRRLIAVGAMFIGALIGATLVLHTRIVTPLAIALCIILIIALATQVTGRSNPRWTRVED
ncbi:MAG: YoaK family protein [Acidimicrobiales bacterium]